MTLLGYEFRNPAIAKEALTTPSFRMSEPSARDNQRLEFLGDAVLGLLATDWLYANNPDSREGDLTGRRQHMVSSAALCEAADRLGFASLLRRNKGATPLPRNSKTLADAVEAVIGAAWLDGGLAAAKKVFDYLGLVENSRLGELDGNPKSKLQHITQALTPPRTPVYRMVKAEGTSDKPVFTMEVVVEGVGRAEGVAGSIKDAETAAAATLLRSLS